ncbi:P-loop containing nucleoside triphosphate hydrolase protein [Penicillium taxi]|uniref:P-loop containing nucleoside triphosphate hydrolase protein n=1 Tax=Penicillium taxi TaxID=168475 RepID=UPI00254544A1|nr:P-loop containing nucleoside triphosphate hydrolase protein [Penicillium taxi]KAJ5887900.1 P-loop containing nucleoside triphosphate hydrolase protein [Penicillium taxi]
MVQFIIPRVDSTRSYSIHSIDDDLEQPETPPAPVFTVPFRRDLDFVSRGTLLDQLHEKGSVPGSRIALVGLGGVGKSQLSIEYCHRVRHESAETWVFWIHASNKIRFEQSCREIADRVKIPGRQNPQANIFKLLCHWLQDEKHTWVLVLDNLDDDQFLHETPQVSDGQSKTLTRSIWAYFSQISRGSIVITSRSRRVAIQLVEEEEIISVEPMDETQAFALLEKKLGTLTQREDIVQLITALEFMPLAIVQAAAYIKQRAPRQSVRQYLENFQRSDQNKITLLNSEGGHLRRDTEAKNSIIITWQISFDYIQRIKPSSADLLSFMSFFDRQGIPDHLLRQNKEQQNTKIESCDQEESESETEKFEALEDDILVLRDFSMISVSTDGKSFEMHRLVQLSMQQWLKTHKLYERWQGKFIQRLHDNFPNSEIENWPTCQLLFPHVLCAMKQQPKTESLLEDWASLLYSSTYFAWVQGNFLDGKRMAEGSSQARKELLGHENPKTLDSLSTLGLALILGGKWKDAEELQVQVMDTSKRVLGPEHPDTLTTMANLAVTYRNQGRWKEAEELEVQVLDTSKRVLGPEHPDILTSMANLAATYWNQGRWKEAEELEVQVMDSRKRVLRPEHPDTLTSMNNLAATYIKQGRWKEAEELELQVMDSRKRVLRPEHPNTLTSMNNLTATYIKQGRWKEAEELEVQVLDTSKRVLGPEHPDTLTSMNNLAATYRNQGRWKEAEELEVQVLDTSKRVLGPEHPDTLTSMASLAATYRNQGRWKEAEELEVQVLDTRKRVLGPEHPDTRSSMASLAATYWNQGRWKEAEELQVQVLDTRKRVLGPEHPDTLTSLASLAATYWNQGRWKEAEELEVQVLDTSKRVLGPEHPSTLTSMANLAATYWNQGRWKEAEELELQVMDTSKRVLGPEHPDTLSRMNNLACTMDSLGEHAAASQLMTECIRLRSQVLGPDHPQTLSSISSFNSWRAQTGGNRRRAIFSRLFRKK